MRILVADDHGIVRAGIKLLLERQPDLEVVAEAADGVEAVEQALAARPDLCILDVGDAADDRAAGRPGDPLAPPRRARADALDARRRALPVRGAEGRRVGLRAQARGRPGPGRRGPRGGPRRGVPDQRRRALDHPPVDGRRRRRPGGPADPARGGGRQADRRGAHQRPDRRDPPPVREDGRVPPRQRAAQAGDARPRRARALRDPARVWSSPSAALYHRAACAPRSTTSPPPVPARLPWINVADAAHGPAARRAGADRVLGLLPRQLDPHAALHEGLARALRATTGCA